MLSGIHFRCFCAAARSASYSAFTCGWPARIDSVTWLTSATKRFWSAGGRGEVAEGLDVQGRRPRPGVLRAFEVGERGDGLVRAHIVGVRRVDDQRLDALTGAEVGEAFADRGVLERAVAVVHVVEQARR